MFLLKCSCVFGRSWTSLWLKHQWNHLQSNNNNNNNLKKKIYFIYCSLFSIFFLIPNCLVLVSRNYYIHVRTTRLCFEKILNFLWKYLLDLKNSGHKLFTDYHSLWRKKQLLVQASLTHNGIFYSYPIRIWWYPVLECWSGSESGISTILFHYMWEKTYCINKSRRKQQFSVWRQDTHSSSWAPREEFCLALDCQFRN